ncbi:hypothetical protein GCM10010405_30880 [Streptomyces macrosporus]|uniref:Helicase C-terminal domain-containing protein n=1 Tax=Streptomyces macrosporus TaxID=44032 RepID=A0ABN3JZQ5_9ACTN
MPSAPCNGWLAPQKRRRRPEPLPARPRAADPARGLDRRLPDLSSRHTSTDTDLTKPYLTATPRILAAARPQKDRDGKEVEIASMTSDPDGPYGEWIFELGLSESIERGILAGFEIDVLEIHDPSPVLGESEEAQRGRRLALLQTALLEHAAAHNLKTVMVFHQRVEEAAAFAEQLPKTAAELYAIEASAGDLAAAEKLPASSIGAEFYDLEPGRHVPPERVWAAWLCGDHLVAERREVIRQFANGVDANNRRVHRAFLGSVRVLGEGVDIVGTRGVEAVCFADTRASQVEIVQNIGRALRPNPDGTAKTARIIVPVFLTPGEDPSDMVASASFAPLVAVLQGLRSHDERLIERSPPAPCPAAGMSVACTCGGTRRAGSSVPAPAARARTTRTEMTARPSRRCCTSPPPRTRPPSPRFCARGCIGPNRWCGWRVTRPSSGGGTRTASPGCMPSRMTSRSK